jgi:hypothetical protein
MFPRLVARTPGLPVCGVLPSPFDAALPGDADWPLPTSGVGTAVCPGKDGLVFKAGLGVEVPVVRPVLVSVGEVLGLIVLVPVPVLLVPPPRAPELPAAPPPAPPPPPLPPEDCPKAGSTVAAIAIAKTAVNIDVDFIRHISI